MLRVFSPTGFNVIFPEIKYSESRITWMLDFTDVGGGVFGALGAYSWVLNQDLQDL
jgi:hypothetical protein